MTNFEKKTVVAIVNLIKKNQEFLTQPENLPLLAKLGYVYEFLHIAGRVAYGFEGVIKKGSTCEDNPKYAFLDYTWKTQKIGDLIYDAWGLHVGESRRATSYKTFYDNLFKKSKVTEFQKKLNKVHKTFDEWVEILTNKRYRYSSIYPTRNSVINHMLLVIGNGYRADIKNGVVIATASGADQNDAIYANWKNAKLTGEYLKIIKTMVTDKEVKTAINASYKQIKKYKEDDFNENYGEIAKALKISVKQLKKKLENQRQKMKKEALTKPMSWYPICNYSIIDTIYKHPEKFHESYVVASLEACVDILKRKDEKFNDTHEKMRHANNVKFATKFVNKLGKTVIV